MSSSWGLTVGGPAGADRSGVLEDTKCPAHLCAVAAHSRAGTARAGRKTKKCWSRIFEGGPQSPSSSTFSFACFSKIARSWNSAEPEVPYTSRRSRRKPRRSRRSERGSIWLFRVLRSRERAGFHTQRHAVAAHTRRKTSVKLADQRNKTGPTP